MAERLHVQATAWGPHVLSLRHMSSHNSSQDNWLWGSTTLSGKETEALAGSSRCCIPGPRATVTGGASPPPLLDLHASLLTSCLTFCSSSTS